MKKWHMEGIISSANNRRRRLVILNDNRMYLALDGDSLKSARKPVFLRSLKDFAGHVLGRT